jgi:mannosyltransferase OCH1-like enzyme
VSSWPAALGSLLQFAIPLLILSNLVAILSLQLPSSHDVVSERQAMSLLDDRQILQDQFLRDLDLRSNYTCPDGMVRIHDTHMPSSHEKTQQRIPKIVFQTARSRCLTPSLANLTSSWRWKGWSYYFFDDDAMMHLMTTTSIHLQFDEFPLLKSLAQNCMHYGTIKADILRYLLLWRYGGVYADLDTFPTPEFSPSHMIQSQDDAFFVVQHYWMLSQYFMASAPQHPLFFYTIQRALHSLFSSTDTGSVNAAVTTGPHALHRGFVQFREDVGVHVPRARARPVKQGHFVGTNNRTVTVVGRGDVHSQQYVVAEGLAHAEKLSAYKKLNMTHNQIDKLGSNGMACLSLLQGTELAKPRL